MTSLARYTDADLDLDLRWWAAANFLTVGQIYLQANPLLREPLRREHIKPRLLGHWGTSPGLSMIYTLLNRVIRATDTDWIYVTGPGHGGPALVANCYLEGTYSEVYPKVSPDLAGLLHLVRQFSTPGGIPSHVRVQTPGSIRDGEAETGPLAASWKLPDFLRAKRDGAVLPILHLNGYKISGPTTLGRADDERVSQLLRSQGWDPIVVAGDKPDRVFPDLYDALSRSLDRMTEVQTEARSTGSGALRPGWPAIVLRTPKGWTGPHEVDGVLVEGTFRAHQVPLANVRENPEHLAILDRWMRSYRPEELFDESGRLIPELGALAPV